MNMPGVHDTVVQGAEGLQGVAVLVEWLAAKFLDSHGTAFTSRIHLTPKQVCENYAIAKKTMPEYAALARHGGLNIVAGLGGRAPARKIQAPNAVQSEYFVNWHHQREFRSAFPHVYHLAFQSRLDEQALTRLEREGVHELYSMKVSCRNSYSLSAS